MADRSDKNDNIYLLNPRLSPLSAESRENGYVAVMSIAEKGYVRRLLLRNEALQQEVKYLMRVLYLTTAFAAILALIALASI